MTDVMLAKFGAFFETHVKVKIGLCLYGYSHVVLIICCVCLYFVRHIDGRLCYL